MYDDDEDIEDKPVAVAVGGEYNLLLPDLPAAWLRGVVIIDEERVRTARPEPE